MEGTELEETVPMRRLGADSWHSSMLGEETTLAIEEKEGEGSCCMRK